MNSCVHRRPTLQDVAAPSSSRGLRGGASQRSSNSGALSSTPRAKQKQSLADERGARRPRALQQREAADGRRCSSSTAATIAPRSPAIESVPRARSRPRRCAGAVHKRTAAVLELGGRKNGGVGAWSSACVFIRQLERAAAGRKIAVGDVEARGPRAHGAVVPHGPRRSRALDRCRRGVVMHHSHSEEHQSGSGVSASERNCVHGAARRGVGEGPRAHKLPTSSNPRRRSSRTVARPHQRTEPRHL